MLQNIVWEKKSLQWKLYSFSFCPYNICQKQYPISFYRLFTFQIQKKTKLLSVYDAKTKIIAFFYWPLRAPYFKGRLDIIYYFLHGLLCFVAILLYIAQHFCWMCVSTWSLMNLIDYYCILVVYLDREIQHCDIIENHFDNIWSKRTFHLMSLLITRFWTFFCSVKYYRSDF